MSAQDIPYNPYDSVSAVSVPRPLLVPWSPGEIIDLDGPTNDLAEARDQVRDVRDALAAFCEAIDSEFVRRIDQANRTGEHTGYTVRHAGWEVKVPGPEPTVAIDAVALRKELLHLQLDGELGDITLEAIEACFKTKTEWSALKRPLGHLSALEPRVKDAVDAHTHEEPKRRAATVKRLDGTGVGS